MKKVFNRFWNAKGTAIRSGSLCLPRVDGTNEKMMSNEWFDPVGVVGVGGFFSPGLRWRLPRATVV